jgi:hypothetical protein
LSCGTVQKDLEEEGIKTKYKAEETIMVERVKRAKHREKTRGIKKKKLNAISSLARFDHSFLCSGNHDS